MENHLVDGAVKLAGDAADFVGREIVLPLGAAVLTAITPAAHADTMKVAPVASQVAPIKVEVTKATLQELNIDPRRLEQFNKLSAPRQGLVLFFLDGLKKAKLAETATLKTGAEKLVFLFTNHEINETSRDAMSKMDGTLKKVRDVDSLIAELSDPKTYGAVLVSNSPYGQRFAQVKQEMTATHTEAEMLQAKAEKMDSPELAAAKKREADSAAALAATRAERANVQRTNAALDQVLATARKH